MSAATGERRGAKRKHIPHVEGVDRNECWKAARALLSAFSWAKSDEGAAYWASVHTRLMKLSGKKA